MIPWSVPNDPNTWADTVEAMMRRYLDLMAMRPLVLVHGVPNAGERSVFSLTGWCFGSSPCTNSISPLFDTPVPGRYHCPHCRRPRGEGLRYYRA